VDGQREEAVVVEHQWRRLREMKTRKGRQWGIAVFGGGRRRGGSTVPEPDDTMKSGAEAGDAEGVDWRPKVEDNQRKLGQWAKCAIGPNC
jgi:hypothetical protein